MGGRTRSDGRGLACVPGAGLRILLTVRKQPDAVVFSDDADYYLSLCPGTALRESPTLHDPTTASGWFDVWFTYHQQLLGEQGSAL